MWLLALDRFVGEEGAIRVNQKFWVQDPMRIDYLIAKGFAEPLNTPKPTPKLFDDSRVVIIAGGPSLTKEDIALAQMLGYRAVVINDGYRLAPWADILYACDGKWWKVHHEAAKTSGVKRFYTQDESAARDYSLELIRSRNEPGLCLDPNFIHQGGNSGYQAINLAYHMGAREIALLGFDMGKDGKKSHWFGSHPAGLEVPSPYDEWVRKFDALANDLKAQGVRILNCSRKTRLTCFEVSTIETAFN